MNPRYKKVYTCTPVAFHANEWFFIRDSGLISRALRRLEAESKVILPLPHYDDDRREEIIRTEYQNLESAVWWKSLGIDGLVLYSWGAPRYRKIAKAVRQAGIRLVIHMDSSGDFTYSFPPNASLLRKIYLHLLVKAQDFFRAKHLSYAHTITMCPEAASAVSKMLFYDASIVEKCFPMACPVDSACSYDGQEKKDIILSIGRWDDTFQKRPEVLMRTLEAFYATPNRAETHIYGTITTELQHWWSSLPLDVSRHIKLKGNIPNQQLRDVYKQAKIILCTSRYEGSHNVSAEALCCGCSVVTTNRPGPLRDVHWYTTKNSGTIAQEDTPESLARAICHELELWNTGKRNPYSIAESWQPFFHPEKVFNTIFQ